MPFSAVFRYYVPRLKLSRVVVLGLAYLFCGYGIHSALGVEDAKFKLSGDVRLRYEKDWESQNGSGVARTDRNRVRFRARASVAYSLSEAWTLGARLRSGNSESQQSPHLTILSDSDNANDDLDGFLDRYFVSFKEGDFSFWLGRNSFPFWQQNEFFWDEDVTPTGVSATGKRSLGEGTVTTTVGAFALPDGGRRLNGRLYSGQVKFEVPVSRGQVTVAAALHDFEGEDGAKALRNRNGARDYTIGVVSGQWTFLWGEQPLVLGLDEYYNFKDYRAAEVEPFAASSAGERSGTVLSAKYGQLKQSGDWQAAYYYADIGTFSVNASYAQDDWVRFGSATQTDGSDISGHEFRFSYAFAGNLNVVTRLYLVDAITTVQDGKRFRVDLNYKF